MATTELALGDSAETPISIYLGLEEGRTANLEAVAEAALAWVASLREMTAIVEPILSVRVEIVDGDAGSLWLNTLAYLEGKLEQIEAGGAKFPRLWALARGLAIIVIATPVAVTAEDVWRRLVGENPEVVELSPETRKELIEQFRMALQPDVAKDQKKRFFRALEKDPAITGVGVSSRPSERPSEITSRESFSAYVNSFGGDEMVETTRRRPETMEVTLVSPVLENAERSWRFRVIGMPEFGAIMRDKEFLLAIEEGRVHVELRQGIEMTVVVEFRERLEGGAWAAFERNVVRVIHPTYDPPRRLL